MSVSGKRRCQTGHHLTKPSIVDGVEGETCKRCGAFLLTILPAYTRADVARWFAIPKRFLRKGKRPMTRRMTAV
ncbi:MAG: hypothetical protein IPJ61_21645 [Tessaracoccus sp.]|uniref:hypothetical protein n=1 Tax=Tessaracoccus sp. TaxID=1971211 RepID=UPI001EB80940|nr:hypothetical protein [Tessaracoccus sp.]MBK7823594.1 hypothetical protein [Tessaracoccus sp.]